MDLEEILILGGAIFVMITLPYVIFVVISESYTPEEIKYLRGEIFKVNCTDTKCSITFKDGRVIENVTVASYRQEDLIKSEGKKVLLKLKRLWYLEDIKCLK